MPSWCPVNVIIILHVLCVIAEAATLSTHQLSLACKNNGTEHQMDATYVQRRHTAGPGVENQVTTTNLRSGKGQTLLHRQLQAGTAHGILSMIGWGTLLPVGVIIARLEREFPVEYEEWRPLHMLCQISGYIVGTLGWGIGLWLPNSTDRHRIHTPITTHRILGILVFTSATIQILASFLRPRRDGECSKGWEIFHQSMEYTIIALSIANIFVGMAIPQSHSEIWKWVYVGTLAVLGLLAAALEMFRWIIRSKV